jgi:hypothetical protein
MKLLDNISSRMFWQNNSDPESSSSCGGGQEGSSLNTTSLQVICLAGVEAQYSRYILNQNSLEAWAMSCKQKQNNFASKSLWVQSNPVNCFLMSLEFLMENEIASFLLGALQNCNETTETNSQLET